MKRFWADLSDIFQEEERSYIVWNDEAQFFSGLRGGKPVFSESYDDAKPLVVTILAIIMIGGVICRFTIGCEDE